MLFLKYLLMIGGIGMFVVAAAILGYDLYLEIRYRRMMAAGSTPLPPPPRVRWRTAIALAMLAWAPIFIARVCRSKGSGF